MDLLHASLETWPFAWEAREGPSVSFLAHLCPLHLPRLAMPFLPLLEAAVRTTSAYVAALWALESEWSQCLDEISPRTLGL